MDLDASSAGVSMGPALEDPSELEKGFASERPITPSTANGPEVAPVARAPSDDERHGEHFVDIADPAGKTGGFADPVPLLSTRTRHQSSTTTTTCGDLLDVAPARRLSDQEHAEDVGDRIGGSLDKTRGILVPYTVPGESKSKSRTIFMTRCIRAQSVIGRSPPFRKQHKQRALPT